MKTNKEFINKYDILLILLGVIVGFVVVNLIIIPSDTSTSQKNDYSCVKVCNNSGCHKIEGEICYGDDKLLNCVKKDNKIVFIGKDIISIEQTKCEE